MDDVNFGILEGDIVYPVDVQEKDGKKAYNFVVETKHYTKLGGQQGFRFQCVSWNKEFERFVPLMKPGEFVRVYYHLQENKMEIGEGKFLSYNKACVDRIEFNNM